MNVSEASTGPALAPQSCRLPEAASLFLNTCTALACGRLRLKPRERQLCLLLAVESFGKGFDHGRLDLNLLWERLGPSWRRNELLQILEEWRRAGWIGVDAVVYRLAPDRLPGWAECFLPPRAGSGSSSELALRVDHCLATVASELSQERACEARVEWPPGAEISHRNCEIFAPQLRNVSETFDRLNVSTTKRNVEGNCENSALAERVRDFVGQSDWVNPKFWNAGKGWRAQIFSEEAALLEGSLNYLVKGLKAGEIKIRKTRGAALWEQFQRERKEVLRRSSGLKTTSQKA